MVPLRRSLVPLPLFGFLFFFLFLSFPAPLPAEEEEPAAEEAKEEAKEEEAKADEPAEEAAPVEEPAADAEGAAPAEAAADAEPAKEAPKTKPRPRPTASPDAERKEPNLFLDTPSATWILDFAPQRLKMISPKEGLGAGRVYWYLVYTLANPAQEARETFIEITASSDHDRRYADLYLPAVERAIEKKEGTLWGKTDLYQLLAKRKPDDPKYHYVTLKPGEKRKCVAIFNKLDANANKIKVKVAGLSNDVRQYTKEDGTRELEERIRELNYERAGDEYAMTLDSFQLRGQDWTTKRVDAPAAGGKKR